MPDPTNRPPVSELETTDPKPLTAENRTIAMEIVKARWDWSVDMLARYEATVRQLEQERDDWQEAARLAAADAMSARGMAGCGNSGLAKYQCERDEARAENKRLREVLAGVRARHYLLTISGGLCPRCGHTDVYCDSDKERPRCDLKCPEDDVLQCLGAYCEFCGWTRAALADEPLSSCYNEPEIRPLADEPEPEAG